MSPDDLPTPKGLNFVGRQGFDRFGVDGYFCWRMPVPWVSPTANNVVPFRGTMTRFVRLKLSHYPRIVLWVGWVARIPLEEPVFYEQ